MAAALGLAAFDTSGAGFPNIQQPAAGLLLSGLNAPQQGRTAILAYHNGVLYSVPESASSFSASDDIQVRAWDLADPAHPQVMATLGTSRHPIGAHGYFHDGPLLILGDNVGAGWTFRPTETFGVNTREAWTDQPGGSDGGVGDRGRLYHPFHINSWWSYGAVSGNAVLSRVGGPNHANVPLATWDHLALTGVIGHPIILGNLLIYASDQTRTGIATYDISDPTHPVLLDVLKTGGPGGYWPEVWGNNGHLYVIWPYNNGGRGFRVVDATDPTRLRWVIDRALPGDEPMYIQFQDEFAFIANHKIDLRTFDTVLTLDSAGATRTSDGGTGVDTSQFALPLGNLLVTGGSGPLQGMSVWTHQAAPDQRGPEVGFHIPRAGQTQYPRDLPISLLIHETLDARTLIHRTNFIVRPIGGEPLAGRLIFAFDDTLTFTPDAPLAANTTYEVVLPAGGIRDVAGNAIAGYSFTFSTGATATGNQPPQFSSFAASTPSAIPGAGITFAATATDPDAAPGGGLEFRFDAGDGRPRGDWSGTATAAFEYASPGHYRVTVQARDASGAMASTTRQITVVAPVATPAPSRSSSMAVDALGRAWVVNPDHGTVSVFDPASGALVFDVPVGAEPRGVAFDASGHAWVACHRADRVDVLSGANGSTLASVPTGYGSAPFGIAFDAAGQTAFVTLYGSGRVARCDAASRSITATLEVGPTPRAVAVTGNGARLYVSRFLSPRNHAEIWELDAPAGGGLALSRTLRLPKLGGIPHQDGTAEGRGTLNQLAGLTLSPDQSSVWVVGTKPNIERGTLFGVPLDHDNTVRSAALRVDLASGSVDRALDLDNGDSPSAIGFSPRGDHLWITLQGNNAVLVFDALTLAESAGLGGLLTRLPTDLAPQGLAFAPTARRVLVQNFMGRSVTVFDAASLLDFGDILLPAVTNAIPGAAGESLAPAVLGGKRIFYNAADPRMSNDGYLSCATCHLDGGSDGRVWDFTQRGEGLRNTSELRGRAGMGHGRVHWSGNFDEIQDFERDVRGGFGGHGFLTDEQAAATFDPLGAPKAGLNGDLDQLAAYVTSLGTSSLPRSPHRAADGAHTPEGAAGRAVFQAVGCARCHGGASLTDSAAGTLHDVGTLRTTSGQRLGGSLTGIDTPTLRGIWANAPYFHDGSAPTLESVFEVAGGTVIQAESGSVTGGTVETTAGDNIAINFDHSVTGGLVFLQPGGTLTLSGVDGGTGGIGAIELRYSGSGGAISVQVNGVSHAVVLSNTGNLPAWRTTAWDTARIEGVMLQAGIGNVIVVTAPGGTLALDQVTVSTASRLATAEPHRVVRSLATEDRTALLALLREFDGSPTDAGLTNAPAVHCRTITEVAPPEGNIEVGCRFSEPVAGLNAGEFVLTGSAGGSVDEVTEIVPGTQYRARVSGFSGSGTVGVRLPAAAVVAMDDGTPNLASTLAVAEYTAPAAADPLPALGDEFDAAETLSNWERLSDAEGWEISKLETYDIGTSRPGHLRLMPVAGTWYQDRISEAVFKEITGDFVVTTQVEIRRRAGAAGRPSSDFSLGGLIVRAPRGITAARPFPDPGPNTVLAYPPPAPGNPGAYETDWTPGGESYLRFTFGTAWPASHPDSNQWQYHVSDSQAGGSQVYWDALGVPTGSGSITLQIARVGSTFVFLRRHPGGPWIVEQRLVRADLPATLQVGIAPSTDYSYASTIESFHHNRVALTGGNPDLVVDVDHVRFSRPNAALTPALLAALPVTRTQGAPVDLAGTGAASWLGDAASTPATIAPPNAQPDTASLAPSGKVRVRVLDNDSGAVNPGSIQIVVAPAHGTATPAADGTVLYAHLGSDAGSDAFQYRVEGPGGTSSPATVTLNIVSGTRLATSAVTLPASPPPTAIQLVPAFTGVTLANPIAVASPPGDTQRLFVAERGGRVVLISDVTSPTPASSVFLDLPAILAPRGESVANHSQYGLVGLTFHPGFATNRRFFVFYSVSIGGVVYERLSGFTARADAPNLADPASESVLIQQRDDFGDHLGGDLHFGPDGYLYVSLGDEGGQQDSSGNAQRIDGEFFSAIMRLDVDRLPGNPEPNLHPSVPLDGGVARYRVPADNPFVLAGDPVAFNGQNLPAASVRTEFWAVGFRNPWRFSFDSATGELWCGDVGQNAWEEIDIVTAGGNYGWSFLEGTHPGPRAASMPPGFSGVPPVYEYSHGTGTFQGVSVTGGRVYRGSRFPSLTGAYFFSDWLTGHIWTLRRPAGGGVEVERVAGEGGIVSFGADPSNGDLLLVDHDGQRLLRLVVTGSDAGFPSTLSATGLFADLSDLTPSPGVLPYDINLRFWSDHAIKRRWFGLTDAAGTLGWTREGTWSAPAGAVWVKHFDLELERGNPATARRIETRVLVRTASGSYGVSYRWNEAGTDATLVPDEGSDFVVQVTESGVTRPQHYRIPSRAECLVCHTPQAGHALSFNTRQWNRGGAFGGRSGNQIALLHEAGYFAEAPESPALLARHFRPDEEAVPLTARVRSYLAVNCANCHRAGGTAPPTWDGRPELTLAQTGLINGPAANNGGDPLQRLVVPGDADRSVMLNRIGVRHGFTRMPPIGSTELDDEAIGLLSRWITNDLPSRAANQPPVANPDAVPRIAHRAQKIPVATLFANDVDPDGASGLALLELGATTERGVPLLRQGNTIVIGASGQPPAAGSDRFVYFLTDGVEVVSAIVELVPADPSSGVTRNIVAATMVDGTRRFRIAGIPGRSYRLQRSFGASGPWSDVAGAAATGTASAVGEAVLIDANPPGDAPAVFYRAVQ